MYFRRKPKTRKIQGPRETKDVKGSPARLGTTCASCNGAVLEGSLQGRNGIALFEFIGNIPD